jgi:hypothetical protein
MPATTSTSPLPSCTCFSLSHSSLDIPSLSPTHGERCRKREIRGRILPLRDGVLRLGLQGRPGGPNSPIRNPRAQYWQEIRQSDFISQVTSPTLVLLPFVLTFEGSRLGTSGEYKRKKKRCKKSILILKSAICPTARCGRQPTVACRYPTDSTVALLARLLDARIDASYLSLQNIVALWR